MALGGASRGFAGFRVNICTVQKPPRGPIIHCSALHREYSRATSCHTSKYICGYVYFFRLCFRDSSPPRKWTTYFAANSPSCVDFGAAVDLKFGVFQVSLQFLHKLTTSSHETHETQGARVSSIHVPLRVFTQFYLFSRRCGCAIWCRFAPRLDIFKCVVWVFTFYSFTCDEPESDAGI